MNGIPYFCHKDFVNLGDLAHALTFKHLIKNVFWRSERVKPRWILNVPFGKDVELCTQGEMKRRESSKVKLGYTFFNNFFRVVY